MNAVSLSDLLIETLNRLNTANNTITNEDFCLLLKNKDFILAEGRSLFSFAREKANNLRIENFSNKIYIRALIEVSNYCKNDCFYCGIRHSNTKAERFRLSKDDILSCCEQGYEAGFRTFVLQGGEDPFFTDDKVIDIVSTIRKNYPDCAITLSIGEKPKSSYQKYKDAGADRFLLREETGDKIHYGKLHPSWMSHENRLQCLRNLKNVGFQAGAGFMVGSPYQTVETLAKDLIFIRDLKPQMIGIGPFIPHKDSPFKDFPHGDYDLTLYLLSLLRIMFPKVLLPSTTALASLKPEGRIEGILSGANVVMPNISPLDTRKKYALYNNKLSSGAEAVEGLALLREELKEIGCEVAVSRGDFEG